MDCSVSVFNYYANSLIPKQLRLIAQYVVCYFISLFFAFYLTSLYGGTEAPGGPKSFVWKGQIGGIVVSLFWEICPKLNSLDCNFWIWLPVWKRNFFLYISNLLPFIGSCKSPWKVYTWLLNNLVAQIVCMKPSHTNIWYILAHTLTSILWVRTLSQTSE